jgi:N-acetylglucosamine kinase-like BadF-type ATPase
MRRERSRAGRPAVLAVDGGNSKAEAALVDRDGRILGAARRSGRANIGQPGAVDALASVVGAASADAGIPVGDGAVARVGVYCLAGADFPIDHRRVERTLGDRGWTDRTMVYNDTFAVLRAGTDRGWGVAVVCGAGMNCVGVAPNGRVVRFPALGPLSGDLAAGGEWVGLAALAAAIRARDGRGDRTELERAVPRQFGMARPEAVMRAIHRRRLDESRLTELPPVVFRAAASGDAVARGILDVLADEVIAMVTAAIRRLHVGKGDPDVVLGGGIFRAEDDVFFDRVRSGIQADAPRSNVSKLETPPLLGAALIGLDRIRAGREASRRLRSSIGRAMTGVRRGRAGSLRGRVPGGV